MVEEVAKEFKHCPPFFAGSLAEAIEATKSTNKLVLAVLICCCNLLVIARISIVVVAAVCSSACTLRRPGKPAWVIRS
jgi:hypothetical protein